jgi:hypothetical protein
MRDNPSCDLSEEDKPGLLNFRFLNEYWSSTFGGNSTWCEYYEFPARLLASGAAQIRERHVTRFKERNLFGKLIRRSVVDNLVVDHEVGTRTFADGIGEIDVLAIYQMENEKFAKACFKMGSPRHAQNPD